MLEIRRLHEEFGHVQEVIVQNFRVKPTIPMRAQPEPESQEFLQTIAAARAILGHEINLQAPPNLSADNYPALLQAASTIGRHFATHTRSQNPEAP
ncbi:MAG: hypothetical protein U0Y68_23745 [Blastocatellia bacterium]